MGNFFNMDNVFFVFMGKVFDVCLISIIWLLCCIPIITIGPATSALYYATVKVIRKERGYLTREYFKSFKMNFKVGLISEIILLILAVILYFNMVFSRQMDPKIGNILYSVYISLGIILSLITIFLFPILSRFTLNVRQLFKMSALLALRHLPSAIVCGVIVAAALIASLVFPPAALILPAVVCLLCSFLMERILKKYTEVSEVGEGETPADEWYL